jgi:hypothetical protein
MVAESIATLSFGEASHQAQSERPSPRHTFEDDKDDIWNFEGQNCIRRELLVSPIADRVHEVTSIVLSLDDSRLYSAKFTRVFRSRALAHTRQDINANKYPACDKKVLLGIVNFQGYNTRLPVSLFMTIPQGGGLHSRNLTCIHHHLEVSTLTYNRWHCLLTGPSQVDVTKPLAQ